MSSCIECRYAQARVASGDEPVLECRRYPPAVIVLDGDPMTVWTQVDGDDLCGEWSPPSDPPIATSIGLNLDYHEATRLNRLRHLAAAAPLSDVAFLLNLLDGQPA